MAESKSFSSSLIPRRDFLKASSVAAVGIAASGLLRPDVLLAAGDAPVSLPLLGVGFTADDVTQKNVRLTDARSVLSGDPTFLSRGARLTIASFGPAESRSKKSAPGAAIDAIFPVLGRENAKFPRFQAWCYRVKESGVEAGNTSFTIPVTATDGIQLIVRPLAPIGETAPVAIESPFNLALGTANGAYKLQKGIYVVAFRDDASNDVAPIWERLTLVRHGERELSVPGARFAHVVLSVDYAS
jgi:hypothetical protein